MKVIPITWVRQSRYLAGLTLRFAAVLALKLAG